MAENERAQGVLHLTAQAVKAFLEAFDPLERALGDLVRSGYTVRVFVTAEDPAVPREPITYVIEIDGESAEDGSGWSQEDEAFLRGLQVRMSPAKRPGRQDGEIGE